MEFANLITWRSTRYGLFLGFVLALAIVLGYALAPHSSDDGPAVPLAYLGMFCFFALAGFLETRRSQNPLSGLLTGLLTGAIAMTITGLTFFLVHNFLFFDQARQEPEKLLGLANSGLKTMREYLVYNNIRGGLLGILLGTISGGLFGTIGALISRLNGAK